jgi:hypothetical protein
MSMRHKCRDSIVVCNLPVTARAGLRIPCMRLGREWIRFRLQTILPQRSGNRL